MKARFFYIILLTVSWFTKILHWLRILCLYFLYFHKLFQAELPVLIENVCTAWIAFYMQSFSKMPWAAFMMRFLSIADFIASGDPPSPLNMTCSHPQKYGSRYVYIATTSFTYKNTTRSSSNESQIFTNFSGMSITISSMFVIWSQTSYLNWIDYAVALW